MSNQIVNVWPFNGLCHSQNQNSELTKIKYYRYLLVTVKSMYTLTDFVHTCIEQSNQILLLVFFKMDIVSQTVPLFFYQPAICRGSYLLLQPSEMWAYFMRHIARKLGNIGLMSIPLSFRLWLTKNLLYSKKNRAQRCGIVKMVGRYVRKLDMAISFGRKIPTFRKLSSV